MLSEAEPDDDVSPSPSPRVSLPSVLDAPVPSSLPTTVDSELSLLVLSPLTGSPPEASVPAVLSPVEDSSADEGSLLVARDAAVPEDSASDEDAKRDDALENDPAAKESDDARLEDDEALKALEESSPVVT